MRALSLLALALASLTSCTVQAKLVLQPAGAVALQSEFAVQGPTLEAWKSLRDLDPSLPADPLDPGLLERGLGEGSRVTQGEGTTTVALTIPAPAKLFPSLRTGPDVWDMTLDRAAVRKLLTLTAWGKSAALDALLPAPGTKVSEAEYRDLLVYLLGPGVSETAARALIEASTVELTIEAPRNVKAAALATSISGRTAFYRWPLLKVLTLDPPIRLRVLY